MDRKTELISPSAYRALASRLGVAPEDFPDPLYVVDRLGRVIYCNRAYAELVGYRAEQVVGMLSLLFYPPEAAPVILMRRVHALLGHAVPPQLRTEIRRRGGGMMPVELSVNNLASEGQIVGRVAIVRQIGA
jgi:PAS domain S-box-containing protein